MNRRGFLGALLAVPLAPVIAHVEAKRARERETMREIARLLRDGSKTVRYTYGGVDFGTGDRTVMPAVQVINGKPEMLWVSMDQAPVRV